MLMNLLHTYEFVALMNWLLAVFPQRKFYTEQMFILLRTKRNHADTQTVKCSNRTMRYIDIPY